MSVETLSCLWSQMILDLPKGSLNLRKGREGFPELAPGRIRIKPQRAKGTFGWHASIIFAEDR